MVNASHGLSSQHQSYDNNLDDSDEKQTRRRRVMYIVGGIVVVIIIIVAIILGVKLGKSDNNQDGPSPDPQPGPTPTPSIKEGYNMYQGSISQQSPSGVYGIANFMQPQQLLSSQSKKISTHPQNISVGNGNNITNQIKWSLEVTGVKQATFKVENNLEERFEVPQEQVPKMFNDKIGRLDSLGINNRVDPIGFEITSFIDNQILVSTLNQTLFLTDKYLQMDFKLPTQHLFGFGERNHEFKLSEGSWTMWASGQQPSYDDGTGFKQSYGVHPFLLVKARNSTKSNEYFGMFFRNVNGQSPVIKFKEDGTSILSYITIGGKIEVNFFLKGTAKEIIAQYHNYIGKPALPPFWALGFHQNSKLIKDSATYVDTIQNFSKLGVKLEALWLDTQYMNDQQEFTLNPNMNSSIDQLLKLTKSNNIKLIPVLGNGIKLSESKLKLKADSAQCLLNDLYGELYSEKSIADQTVFLDWFLEDSKVLWGENLDAFHKLLSNSPAGFVLDLNENTIFNNRNYSSNQSICETPDWADGSDSWYQSCPQENETQSSTYKLPFIPSKSLNFDYLSIDLNSTHPGSNTSEYNVHSLNGHMQLQTTYWNLKNDSLFNGTFKGQRPFTMTRSTFAGSGKYGGHFFGDNEQSFEGLKMYINSLLNFNMFGIPFSGGSICGMRGVAQQMKEDVEELCGAWFQVAAWVPFAYQNINEETQTSDITKLPSSLFQTVNGSLSDRFIHLRHIYTCLFMSNQNGGSCYDPVYFHFPELEIQEYKNTFIVGDAILVQPVLNKRQEGTNSYETFFPPGNWLNLRTKVIENGQALSGSYKMVGFTNIGAANAWLRQGQIIQQQFNSSVKNSDDLFKTPISLLAHLDQNKHAEGYVFLDNDGVSELGQGKQTDYEIYKILINGGSIFALNQNQDDRNVNSKNIGVNNITIFGELDYFFVDFACFVSKDSRKITNLTFIKPDQNTFTIKMNDGSKFDFSTMNAIHFGNSQKNINLCRENLNAITNYTWKEPIVMVGNNFSGTLVSDKSFVEPLKVNFLLLATPKGDTVSVTWNYENQLLANKTFKLPDEIINMSQYNISKITSKFTLKDYIHINQSSTILFSIVNPIKSETVFDLTGLILQDYLNVIESQAILDKNEKGIIGLGQHVGNSLYLDKGVYSLWSRDKPEQNQKEVSTTNQLGTHPFYMGMDSNQTWFGVFTRLSSAQDWWIDYLSDDQSNKAKIQTISTGNSAGEMYFIFADTAPELITTYHQNIVGLPVLNPLWALGWHQSRWGYSNDSELRNVYNKYNYSNIPIDTFWSHVDYMDNYKDFTLDPKNYAGLPQLISDLHQDNKHYIPILGSGIPSRINSDYTPYTEGEKNGYFITYGKDQTPLIGYVLPGETVFPDFSQDGTKSYWQSQLTAFQQQISFDGLWLDMNEASNICSGVCSQDQRISQPVKNKLPYIPTGRDLESFSISLDAYHKGNDAIELDMHSLSGTLEVSTTSDWFKKNNKRPMVFEKAGFAGVGKFGSRYIGNNYADQDHMGHSLVGVQANNIFGIPLVGADICGSVGNTTAELCARWHVVGSFYPFSRNHKDFRFDPQEPYLFTEIYESTTSYQDIMIQAIRNKYRLAKYYYTQMYLISKNGGTLIQPLFFQFPSDINSKSDLQYNMMIGEALKLGINSDKLDQNFTSLIFPQGATWCNLLYSKEELKSCIIGGQDKLNRSSKAYEFDLHLRDGYIVPLQNSFNIRSTYDLLQQPVELHMNLRCVLNKNNENDCSAKGILINDDGATLTSDPLYKSVTFNLILLANPFADGKQTPLMQLSITKDQPSDYDCKNNFVSQIYIHNADKLFKNSNYTVNVNENTIGETVIETSSNRLKIDLSSQPIDISKLDESGIVFKIKN